MPYIGNTIRAADDYRLIDDISSGFNGSATTFALQVAGSSPVPFPKSPQQILVSVNGVIQEPDPTGASGFNLVGTNIVFSSAPTNGHAFFGIIYATADYLNAGGEFPPGSVGAPSITFTGDEDTGIYRKGSGSVGFVSNATEIANTDSNGITISSGGLILGDSSGASSNRIKLGASNDLQIYHNGSNSLIEDTGTGNLEIKTNGTKVTLQGGNNAMINAIKDGAVELYFNASLRLSTTANGVTLGHNLFLDNATNAGRDVTWDPANDQLQWKDDTKASFGSSSDLQIYHDGSKSLIDNSNGVGNLLLYGNGTNSVVIQPVAGENSIVANSNSSVELFFDNSKKFDTNSGGVKVHGNLDTDDNNKLRIGTSSDLQIFHDGTDSFVQNNTGQLILRTATVESAVVCVPNGAVELYHNAVKKAETTSNGASITGRLDLSDNLDMPDNAKIILGTGDDLEIYHSSGNAASYIQNSTGNLFIEAPASSAVKLRKNGTTETMIVASSDGSVELYYDNSKKFETTSNGATFLDNVRWNDNKAARFGGGDDLQIYHNGSHSIINNTTGSVQVHDSGTEKFRVSGTGTSFKDDIFIANDSDKINIGAGNDLQIYHDGSHSNIVNSTGELKVRGAASQAITFRNGDDSANVAVFNIDDATHLYFDSAHKFSTTSTGIKVVGNCLPNSNDSGQLGTSSVRWQELNITDVIDVSDSGKLRMGDSDDLKIYHNGSASYIQSPSHTLYIQGTTVDIGNGAANEAKAKFIDDGAVELYFDNTKKFETVSAGVQVSSGHLHLPDSSELRLGSDNDFKFYHNGTSAIGQNHTGIFYFGTYSNTALILQTNNTNRWAIQNTGHFVPDANNTVDIGSSSTRVRNIYTNDLNLSNEGSFNDVDGTWGNYTIQEGAEDLFLINRRNGKKFKFNLTEVA